MLCDGYSAACWKQKDITCTQENRHYTGDLFISLLSIARLLEPGLFLGMVYGAEWNQPGPHPQGALGLMRHTDHKPET